MFMEPMQYKVIIIDLLRHRNIVDIFPKSNHCIDWSIILLATKPRRCCRETPANLSHQLEQIHLPSAFSNEESDGGSTHRGHFTARCIDHFSYFHAERTLQGHPRRM